MPGQPRTKNPLRNKREIAERISDMMVNDDGEQPDPSFITDVLEAIPKVVKDVLLNTDHDSIMIPRLVTIRQKLNSVLPLEKMRGINQVKDGKRARYGLAWQSNKQINDDFKKAQVEAGKVMQMDDVDPAIIEKAGR
jgi:hypothetical protein